MNKILSKFIYYIRSYYRWFIHTPKFFWLSMLLTLSPLILIIIYSPSKIYLIRLGLFLQVIGILSIFYDIYQTRKQFKNNSFMKSLKAWFKKRPSKYGSTFHIEPEGITSGIAITDITLTTVPHWDEKKSLEENVKEVINFVKKNRLNIDEMSNELKSEITKSYNKLYEKVNESNSLIYQLENIVEKNATGGLRITFVGSTWLLMGVILSTIPSDLIYLFNELSNINGRTFIYLYSGAWSLIVLVLSAYIFLKSEYFSNLTENLESNSFDLKDENMGKVLIQHISEMGVALLLFDKLRTTTLLYEGFNFIKMLIWVWIPFKFLVIVLLALVSFYSYGRLAIIFGNKNISQAKFLVVLLLSVFTFGMFLITK